MAAAAAQIPSCHCLHSSVHDISSLNSAGAGSSVPFPRKFGSAFATGSPLLIQSSFCKRNLVLNSKPASIRCEQSSNQGGGVDLWIGRLAMVSFATAVTVEIATGKGPLENLGIPTPLPIVALAVAVLVAVLTAYFILQSASQN